MTTGQDRRLLPADHDERMARARLSLDGLSVGDALGEYFFYWPLPRRSGERPTPPAPWRFTDDTAMAISIVETLDECGDIDSDVLARRFADRYRLEPDRGYGGMAHHILSSIGQGVPWKEASGSAFNGEGSMGNGSAMRVGPVGAYFADDPAAAAAHARASAVVTHAHPDGAAGAVAIAVAAATAWHLRDDRRPETGRRLFEAVLAHTPEGATRDGLVRAAELPAHRTPQDAANVLGSGYSVTCSDTVPFTVWCAARHLHNYEEAFWTTVSGLGDRDTTCAIVGSIVAMAVGREGIPPEWLRSRERLPE